MTGRIASLISQAHHDLDAVCAYLNRFRDQPKTLQTYAKERSKGDAIRPAWRGARAKSRGRSASSNRIASAGNVASLPALAGVSGSIPLRLRAPSLPTHRDRRQRRKRRSKSLFDLGFSPPGALTKLISCALFVGVRRASAATLL
jgi:hypothetical protein